MTRKLSLGIIQPRRIETDPEECDRQYLAFVDEAGAAGVDLVLLPGELCGRYLLTGAMDRPRLFNRPRRHHSGRSRCSPGLLLCELDLDAKRQVIGDGTWGINSAGERIRIERRPETSHRLGQP